MENPYDVLGVDKNSSLKEIKDAFRDASKKAHPDAGGSEEEFVRIQEAYAILKDPEKRQKFDETGDDGQRDIVEEVLVTLMDDLLNRGLEEGINLVELIKVAVEGMAQEIDRQAQEAKRKAKLFKRIAKKVKRKKGGKNILSMVAEKKAEEQQQRYERSIVTRAQHQRIVKEIENYSFKFDKFDYGAFDESELSALEQISRMAHSQFGESNGD